MATFAIKYLDKALDGVLDGIEHNVLDRVTTTLLEEFPKHHDLAALGTDLPNLQEAIQFWRHFDLEGKKDFIEAAHRELSASPGSHLSAVQRRADVAEAALTEVGGALLEAPDPVPILERLGEAGRALAALQRQNKKLQLDAKAAESEASTAIGMAARLQELEDASLKLRQELAAEVEKSGALQTALKNAKDESEESAHLRTELQAARNALSALQLDHERVQSQLFEARTKQEEADAAVTTDVELAARDLEAAHARLRQLTWEANQLQKRLEGSGGAGVPEDPPSAARDSANEELLRVLRQELSEARSRLAEAERAREVAEEQLTRATELAQRELKSLKEEVERRAEPREVDNLRAQVASLRALVDAHMEEEGAPPEEPSGNHINAASIHAILQKRNQRVAAEAADLKLRLESSEARCAELADTVKELTASKARQTDLISKLEDDLLHSARPGSGSAPRKPTIISGGVPHSDSSVSLPASEGDTPASGGPVPSVPQEGEAAATPGTQAPTTAASSNALLDIVTGQRDRFRQRMEQLEEELGTAQKEVVALKSRLATAKADNVSLYEKIRYLQRFGQRPSESGAPGILVKVDGAGVPRDTGDAGLGHRFSCGPLELGLNVPSVEDTLIPVGQGTKAGGPRRRVACFPVDDETSDVESNKSAVEQRYAKTYEAKLNPFADFQQKEVESRVRKLPLHDRAILRGSKVLLASKVARIFAAVYLIFIHAFVFAVVYYAALGSVPGGSEGGKALRRLHHFLR